MSSQVKPTPLDDLWEQRVDELALRMEDSPTVWPQIERLHQELQQRGITFRPAFFVSNEWGCPDGQPIIGVPFYLVDPRLHGYEEEHADDLEDAERILIGLRHEAGHAICYAYRLYNDPEFKAVFGAFDLHYHDDYLPEPFSRKCVRHLPGWYAQKHPDEDFAETFAVWLTPSSPWREKYEGTPALRKLEYIDRVMQEVGLLPPVVDPKTALTDPDELNFTVGEFYHRRAIADSPPVEELAAFLDHDFREIFAADGIGTDAASLLWDRRKVIMRSVSSFTGARMYVVRALVVRMVERLRELKLRASKQVEMDAIIQITALVSTLTNNFLRNGHFVT